MKRPHLLVSMGNNHNVLVRLGTEGGAVEVYRLYLGRWDRDSTTRGSTQVTYDMVTRAVVLEHNGGRAAGVVMDHRDARRLLKMFAPPWVEQDEAWDATDEANSRDDDAAKDLRAQRAEDRELKGE